MMPDTAMTEERLDEALKALASAPRRALLRLVASRSGIGDSCCSADDDVCACDLAGAMDMAPSTISHHMGALVRAGLVRARKQGLWVHYSADREGLARVARELESL
jgi:ArsR family transcriptional regulator